MKTFLIGCVPKGKTQPIFLTGQIWVDLMLLQDARDYQILFLASFLALGIVTRDWTLQLPTVAIALVTCLLTQALAQRLQQQLKPSGTELSSAPLGFNWRSPLITALGLSLLLRVEQPWMMAIAGSAAIGSKFLFRVRGKHLFNPGNFGIIVALLLPIHAWVSPGQWGEELWYGLLFLGAGGIVLQRVGRWDTTVIFLGCYASLEALRNLWLGWSWDVWLHRLSSGSLLLFALFMVSDPRSIPDARLGRCLWAGAIALLSFGLRNFGYLPTAVFWALFLLAPLTPVLDLVWAERRFDWREAVSNRMARLVVDGDSGTGC